MSEHSEGRIGTAAPAVEGAAAVAAGPESGAGEVQA